MNEIIIFLIVFFTQAGPAATMMPMTDMEACQGMVVEAPKLIGQKVNGPNGEKVLVNDVQATCTVYHQNKQASN